MIDPWDKPDEIYFEEFKEIIKPPIAPQYAEVVTVSDLYEKTDSLYEEILTRFAELLRSPQIEQATSKPTPGLYLGRRIED